MSGMSDTKMLQALIDGQASLKNVVFGRAEKSDQKRDEQYEELKEMILENRRLINKNKSDSEDDFIEFEEGIEKLEAAIA